MFIAIEVFLPVLFFGLVLLAWHHSRLRRRCQSGIRSEVVASTSLVLAALIYWAGVLSFFFFAYSQIANRFGHQVLGSSWDVRLTWTLSLTLLVLLAVAFGYVVYVFRNDKGDTEPTNPSDTAR